WGPILAVNANNLFCFSSGDDYLWFYEGGYNGADHDANHHWSIMATLPQSRYSATNTGSSDTSPVATLDYPEVGASSGANNGFLTYRHTSWVFRGCRFTRL